MSHTIETKQNQDWKEETLELRSILDETRLNAEIKWGKPAYTYNGKVIVVIQAFKKYFALLFYKGYLLSDPKKVLQKTGPNTKVGRQIRFENVAEIRKLKSTIKSYVKEAAELEKQAAKKVSKN